MKHCLGNSIIEIGHKLIEVKAELPEGKFGEWLEAEFQWTYRTAYRFINVADNFKIDNLSSLDIAPSALYMLSKPSTPEDVRSEAVKRAESGESVTYSTAKEMVESHKSESLLEDEPPCEEAKPESGFFASTLNYL